MSPRPSRSVRLRRPDRVTVGTLSANPENKASRRIMEKLGLIYRGEIPYERVRGGVVVWYALDREA